MHHPGLPYTDPGGLGRSWVGVRGLRVVSAAPGKEAPARRRLLVEPPTPDEEGSLCLSGWSREK
jgi:hypothetical protein